MDSDKARTAVKLLELVVRRQMDVAQALAQWPESTHDDPLLQSSWHDLSHFAADDDIRERDPKYAHYQTNILTKRIDEIKDAYELP